MLLRSIIDKFEAILQSYSLFIYCISIQRWLVGDHRLSLSLFCGSNVCLLLHCRHPSLHLYISLRAGQRPPSSHVHPLHELFLTIALLQEINLGFHLHRFLLIHFPADIGAPQGKSVSHQHIKQADISKEPIVEKWCDHIALIALKEDSLNSYHPNNNGDIEDWHSISYTGSKPGTDITCKCKKEYQCLNTKADIHANLQFDFIAGPWIQQ